MKTKLLSMALLVGSVSIHTALAQGTAFTYQGRLTDNGSLASGNYDLQFTLKDALTSGNTAGTSIAVAPVGATNGVFTVTLDFGSGVFTGAARWLEIGVRTNGSSSAYTVLAPRQPVLPTPYAIYAAGAGSAATATTAGSVSSVPAANITGTISLGQLPSVLLTNNQSGVLLSGTFIGNGAGLTNVAGVSGGGGAGGGGGSGGFLWQTVSGTSAQAAANNGYLATANSQVTVTLPPTADVGDVVRVVGAGSGGWKIAQNSGQSILISSGVYSAATNYTWTPQTNAPSEVGIGAIAISADGAKVFSLGAGQTSSVAYASSDSGVTWALRGNFARNTGGFVDVAASADGTKLVALPATGGPLYTSADSGSNWTARISADNWSKVASSADGTKLFAASYIFSFGVVVSSDFWVSTNSGVNWRSNSFAGRSIFSALASSADGAKLVAGSLGGIYTSSDSGETWNFVFALPANVFAPGSVSGLASSADGTRLVAVDGNLGFIYTSTNSGTNWTARAGPLGRNWRAVASSADGMRLVAGSVYGVSGPDGGIFTSIDSGVTWTLSLAFGSTDWYVVKSSADGTRIVTTSNFGALYTGTVFSTTPGTPGNLTGASSSAVELLYTGGGVFLPVSFIGPITPR
ncbi:MAG: hypothetical protein HY735_11905 [Verrucomicrobia bacterium]|nr:hypothetical protein [Verrucomicrobiota bacterium]